MTPLYIFACNTLMHPQNFMIFGIYKLHNAENEMMLSFVIMSTLIRQRALHTEYFLSAL